MAVPRPKKPTIVDVAREAGVSSTAASYVLSGSRNAERLNPLTRERVSEAARRLGYKANSVGAALRRGYSDTVLMLVVTWELAGSYSGNLLAISRAASSAGLTANVSVATDDAEAEAILEKVRSFSPYGLVVVWDSSNVAEEKLLSLREEGLPIVDLLPPIAPGIPSVTADREQGWHSATSYLIELGHRRIGFVTDPAFRSRSREAKLAGHRRMLAEAGVEWDPDLLQEASEASLQAGYDSFRDLYSRRPDITAIIGTNDALALGAATAAREIGLNVPGDLSVIGGGASREGAFFKPRLTTMQTADSLEQHAADVVEVLMKMRQDPEWVPETIYKPMGLIVRDSTGPALRKP